MSAHPAEDFSDNSEAADRPLAIARETPFNPYRAPGSTAQDEAVAAAPENAEEIRREHLTREAIFKAFGLILLALGTVAALAMANDLATGGFNDFEPTKSLAVYLILGIVVVTLPLFLGSQFLQVAPIARILTTFVAAAALFAFPIGSVLAVILLALMYSKKGSGVFAPTYRAVIAATPQVRPQAKIFGWFMVELFVLVYLVAILGSVR